MERLAQELRPAALRRVAEPRARRPAWRRRREELPAAQPALPLAAPAQAPELRWARQVHPLPRSAPVAAARRLAQPPVASPASDSAGSRMASGAVRPR